MTQAAPLYEDVAGAPDGGEAWWLTTSDDLSLRVATWPPARGRTAIGTVCLFPGRTEYVEKFGRVARHLTDAGFAVLAIDWRGQGLSERSLAERRLGHVLRFEAYQRDVAAVIAFARHRSLPDPWHLLAHSMGGCIGLRALHEGLPVAAVAFSAPMWGISLDAWEIPLAWASSLVAPLIGLGDRLSPRTTLDHLVSTGPFEGNDLTTDRAMWDYMKAQTDRHPDLALGGPTLAWLRAALLETTRLARRPSPATPALTWLGGNERVVSPRAIRRRMAHWPGGDLVEIPGAEHELLMERPEVRTGFLDAAIALFRARG